MRRFFVAVPRFTSILMVLTAAVALWEPRLFLWVHGTSQSILLGVIMLTMGMTLSVRDFQGLVTSPMKMVVGVSSQFLVMPLSALILMTLFPTLPKGVLVGLSLVAACPGAVSSNIMSLLAKGDVAYSVGMTAVNTLLSPFVTPLIVWWLVGNRVPVEKSGLFVTIIFVIGLPTMIGILTNQLCAGKAKFESAKAYFPFLSVVGLGLVIGGVTAQQGDYFLHSGVLIFLFSTLLNVMGYLGGWGVGRMMRFSLESKKTLSIEVGMQNAGLATILATEHFAGVDGAAAMAAFSCVWYAITGAILANFYSRWTTG